MREVAVGGWWLVTLAFSQQGSQSVCISGLIFSQQALPLQWCWIVLLGLLSMPCGCGWTPDTAAPLQWMDQTQAWHQKELDTATKVWILQCHGWSVVSTTQVDPAPSSCFEAKTGAMVK